eukprot:TRINITY_DN61699_c0_g1_i1.p1 TRINITY_DN61699_c0_g1~~TRINITY_DN61699_c0_g1_i1.p1  ORF type:complete len:314 (+),score=88.60 TRINITY_DN61699_c0_g1_i1:26-967(+)
MSFIRSVRYRDSIYAVFIFEERKQRAKAVFLFFFLMIRRPPRSPLSSSSAASDVYKRQGLASAAAALCSASATPTRTGAWATDHDLILLLTGTVASTALTAVTSVTAAIALHHTMEPQWQRFGPDASSVAAGLSNRWDTLAQLQDSAAAILSVCLELSWKTEPSNPAHLLNIAELHLSLNHYTQALHNLLMAAGIQGKFFLRPNSLLTSGPMIRKLMNCTRACEMHSATLALCQLCKPPDMSTANKILGQVEVHQLDTSYFQYLWHLPILEQLMHLCSRAGADSMVRQLLNELRLPEANQWNHAKVHLSLIHI